LSADDEDLTWEKDNGEECLWVLQVSCVSHEHNILG
jgi:hypothetical protein